MTSPSPRALLPNSSIRFQFANGITQLQPAQKKCSMSAGGGGRRCAAHSDSRRGGSPRDACSRRQTPCPSLQSPRSSPPMGKGAMGKRERDDQQDADEAFPRGGENFSRGGDGGDDNDGDGERKSGGGAAAVKKKRSRFDDDDPVSATRVPRCRRRRRRCRCCR